VLRVSATETANDALATRLRPQLYLRQLIQQRRAIRYLTAMPTNAVNVALAQ